jgi:hypothetical protein
MVGRFWKPYIWQAVCDDLDLKAGLFSTFDAVHPRKPKLYDELQQRKHKGKEYWREYMGISGRK